MYQYDAKDVTVLINNVYLTGLGETMITCEKDEELFSTSVGAQGDVCKSVTNNSLGTITVTLQQTSPQKNLMISLANSNTIFPIWVVNPNQGLKIGGTSASIKNFPSVEYAAECGELEFEIQVFDYTVTSN